MRLNSRRFRSWCPVWRRQRAQGAREACGTRQNETNLLLQLRQQVRVSLGIDKARGTPRDVCYRFPEKQPSRSNGTRGQRVPGLRRCFVTPEKRRRRGCVIRVKLLCAANLANRKGSRLFCLFQRVCNRKHTTIDACRCESGRGPSSLLDRIYVIDTRYGQCCAFGKFFCGATRRLSRPALINRARLS